MPIKLSIFVKRKQTKNTFQMGQPSLISEIAKLNITVTFDSTGHVNFSCYF